MAYEVISEYTDRIHHEILKRCVKVAAILDEPLPETFPSKSRPLERINKLRTEIDMLFESLLWYHETVLQNRKFKAQRSHCRKILEEINPGYCEGYFKKLIYAKSEHSPSDKTN
jgi:hypothetical protein